MPMLKICGIALPSLSFFFLRIALVLCVSGLMVHSCLWWLAPQHRWGRAFCVVPLLVGATSTAIAALLMARRTGCQILGKRGDGSISLWSYLVFLPYHLHVRRYLADPKTGADGEQLTHVFGGLHVSGWTWTRKHPTLVRWAGVLDLTCELPRSQSLHIAPAAGSSKSNYLNLPLWDCNAPDPGMIRVGVDFLLEARGHGPVLVHCMNGRGRSVCVLVAALMALHRRISVTSEGEQLFRHGLSQSDAKGVKQRQEILPDLSTVAKCANFVRTKRTCAQLNGAMMRHIQECAERLSLVTLYHSIAVQGRTTLEKLNSIEGSKPPTGCTTDERKSVSFWTHDSTAYELEEQLAGKTARIKAEAMLSRRVRQAARIEGVKDCGQKKEAATQELGSEELKLATSRVLSSWPLSRDKKRVSQHLALCRDNSAGPFSVM
eukprot:g27001.t1